MYQIGCNNNPKDTAMIENIDTSNMRPSEIEDVTAISEITQLKQKEDCQNIVEGIMMRWKNDVYAACYHQ